MFNTVWIKHFRALIHYLQHNLHKTTSIAFTNISAILLKYM
uniref:Uncharacterized protein n=1 Tax=Moniliophthora roreri TaxID=221103 RepID=A0A0W0F315_MONRR